MLGVQSRSSGLMAGAFGADGGDGVFQHLLVEFDADFADVAGLLVAQQVAGAAHVEVVARQGGSRRPACRASAMTFEAFFGGRREMR